MSGDLRRSAFDGDLLDRERRCRPCDSVETNRREEDQDTSEERPAGGSDPGQLEAIPRTAAMDRNDGAFRTRTRARASPWFAPCGHEAGFAAAGALPTSPGHVDRPEQLDLVLEHDTELLVRAAARFGH